MKIDAYFSNLGKYTEGGDEADWISLPLTQEDFAKVCHRIGLNGIDYKEYFFPEYDTDIAGLDDTLPEYTNISALNYCAACIRRLDKPSLHKLEAILLARDYTSDPADVITICQNLDAFDFYPDITTEEELGRYCVDDLKLLQINEKISRYFDYEQYGEAYVINNGGYFTKRGFFCENRKPIKSWDGVVPPEYQVFLPSLQPVKASSTKRSRRCPPTR